MWDKKDNIILHLKPTAMQLIAVPESAYDFQRSNKGNCIWFKLPGIYNVTPIDCDLWQKEIKIIGTITKTGNLKLIDKSYKETDILELIIENKINNNALENQKSHLLCQQLLKNALKKNNDKFSYYRFVSLEMGF